MSMLNWVDVRKMNSKTFLAYSVFIFVILISYIRALFIPLMNNDSGHHALIALRMVETGDYLSLFFRESDYLDKPHFLFWMVALSIKIFGVNAFAYKFPTFLFTNLAIYSTYRLGRKLYSLKVGIVSGLVLATSYAFVLANNDVRMDGILTAAIIFSIWQLIEFIDSNSFKPLLLSALGLAIGFATKGMIGIVMPLMAAFLYIFQKKNWHVLFNIRWIALGGLTVLFLLPVFYSYYLQFDLHPEKIIRGTAHHSGIRFLLFGQSIERYKGVNWGSSGSKDPFLLLHSFLWAFLPWCLIAITALGKSMIRLFKNKLKMVAQQPLFISATIILIFLIMSGSQFKLPHYLNVLFPLFSIITAVYIVNANKKWQNRLSYLQLFTGCMMVVVVLILNIVVFPLNNIIIILVACLLGVSFLLIAFKYRTSIVLLTLSISAFSYFLLNFNFFPKLLEQQAGNELAEQALKKNIPPDQVFYLEDHVTASSFDFHIGRIIPSVKVENIQSFKKPLFVYTDKSGLEMLVAKDITFHQLASHKDFHVTKFTKDLFDPGRRKVYSNLNYLLEIE